MPSSAATLAEVCPSRAAFVQHVPQYGCVLSDEKMQAVLAGDLSGLIVHPAFTYLAQLLGCLMWQIQRQMFMFPQVEYEQLQLLLLALETIDPISEIQLRYLLAIYYLLKRQMQDGEEQLRTAARVVQQHNLTFPVVPDAFYALQPQELTPEQIELIGALAHLIYLDRDSSIVFRVPQRLEKSFDDALLNVAVRTVLSGPILPLRLLSALTLRCVC